MQVDFGDPPVTVYGLTVGGDRESRVTSYHVLTSLNGITFSYVEDGASGNPKVGETFFREKKTSSETFSGSFRQVFRGPEDPHVTRKLELLPFPVGARVVRVAPKTWVGEPGPALAFDVHGCGGAGGGGGSPPEETTAATTMASTPGKESWPSVKN